MLTTCGSYTKNLDGVEGFVPTSRCQRWGGVLLLLLLQRGIVLSLVIKIG